MEHLMKVHFIPASQNAKTGPIPVSIIERASCWPGCALYENGCDAEAGALALHWGRVSRGLARSTHKPVLGDDHIAVENRRLIAAAIKAGFTINLSADNLAHA